MAVNWVKGTWLFSKYLRTFFQNENKTQLTDADIFKILLIGVSISLCSPYLTYEHDVKENTCDSENHLQKIWI